MSGRRPDGIAQSGPKNVGGPGSVDNTELTFGFADKIGDQVLRDVTRRKFEALLVDRPRTVQGTVSGVRVLTDAHLVVEGAIDGRIELEPESFLTVYGMFTPGVVINNGLILAAGRVALPARDHRSSLGRFALATGSIIDDMWRLEPDGTERRVEGIPNVKVTGEADAMCIWVAEENRFVPSGELGPRSFAQG